MRDLPEVIQKMLDVIPENEAELRARLTRCQMNARYTAPEAIEPRWHEMANVLAELLPDDTDALNEWQAKLVCLLFDVEDLSQLPSEQEPELLHRDDLPFEVAEEAVARLQAMFPGMKVVFPGDAPEGTPGLEKAREMTRRMAALHAKTLAAGQCAKCGTVIPLTPWPPKGEVTLPQGWSLYYDVRDQPRFLACPACDDDEEQVVEVTVPEDGP